MEAPEGIGAAGGNAGSFLGAEAGCDPEFPKYQQVVVLCWRAEADETENYTYAIAL